MIPLQKAQDGRSRTITRLLLPIRFHLSDERPSGDTEDPLPYDESEWQYREYCPEDLWKRASYFTVDTSYVLFKRATWLRLERKEGPNADGAWTSFSYLAPPLLNEPSKELIPRT